MREIKKFHIWLIICVIGIYSCGDPVEESKRAEEQIYLDSLAQADLDNIVIDQYIVDNELSMFEDSVTHSGLRFIIIDEGAGLRYPAVNDILSVDYFGTFDDSTPFDTSSRTFAMSYDSAAYVEKGVNVADTMAVKNLDLENALIYLSSTSEALSNPLLSPSKFYSPIAYNHTFDGFGIGTTYVRGFSEGLHKMVPMLSIGGHGMLLIPSAIAYGTIGTESGAIPPNTPIFFKVQLINIRP